MRLASLVRTLSSRGRAVTPVADTFASNREDRLRRAVHCDGCVAYHTKMAHQHGASREEVAETVALAVYMGGGPAAVYGGDALRAYDQFAGKTT